MAKMIDLVLSDVAHSSFQTTEFLDISYNLPSDLLRAIVVHIHQKTAKRQFLHLIHYDISFRDLPVGHIVHERSQFRNRNIRMHTHKLRRHRFCSPDESSVLHDGSPSISTALEGGGEVQMNFASDELFSEGGVM